MKKLLILMLLASGGCGAAVNLPEAASQLELRRSKNSVTIVAGHYAGTDTCTTTASLRGAVIGIGTEDFQIKTTFSGAGIPLEQSIERSTGPAIVDDRFRTSCSSTELSKRVNTIIIRESCKQWVDGDDTCEFAFDGVCDEPLTCPWSTDFADCGPIIWELEKTTTYLFRSDGTVLRNVSQVLVESEIGNDTVSTECVGELTRLSTAPIP